MSRKTPKNSREGAVAAAQYVVPNPPNGYALNDKEKACWDAMVTVRQNWRDFDLILLVKVVRLEVKISEWWEMLERTGGLIRNPRGTPVENPILRSIDTLQRQQLAIITKMQLMTVADPRTLNSEATLPSETLEKNNVLRLLARPQ